MPYALLFIGTVLIVAGIRNTQGQLGKLLVSDFTGAGNFIYWIIAIIVIGSIGYIQGFEKFSRAFMTLIIVGLLLSNQGFFTQFLSAIQSGTAQPAPKTDESLGGSSSSSSGGSSSSSSGGGLSSLLSSNNLASAGEIAMLVMA